MAIISAGYDGSVDEVQFARMLSKVGASEYGVDKAGDFQVTAVSGQDRTVSVAPGIAWGLSVLDTSDANVTVQLDTISSGSRWDMVVLRRDWQPPGGNTSVAVIKGGSSMVLPNRNWGNIGVLDDQPLALVQVTAGKTQPTQIIDLRCWARNGGITARHDLARSYLGVLGTVVEINGIVWLHRVGGNGTAEWVDLATVNDTGWMSSGVTIPSMGWFRRESYRVRVKNGELIARLDLTFNPPVGTLTVDDNGNLPDTTVTVMPAGYRPSMAPWPVQAQQPGVNEWFARVEDDGTLSLTHGVPGAVLRKGDPIRFIMRYPID